MKTWRDIEEAVGDSDNFEFYKEVIRGLIDGKPDDQTWEDARIVAITEVWNSTFVFAQHEGFDPRALQGHADSFSDEEKLVHGSLAFDMGKVIIGSLEFIDQYIQEKKDA